MIEANRFPKMLSYNNLTETARVRLILIVILFVAFFLAINNHRQVLTTGDWLLATALVPVRSWERSGPESKNAG